MWLAEAVVRPGVRLGVDVGAVRVGLAASDPSGMLASPVETVPRDTSSARADLTRIATVARERGAVEVVVGLPRLLSGAEGEAARLARAYAADLALAVHPVPVQLVDERLTTVESHRRLRESGVAGRSQRAVVDQTAAVLILQTALDTERVSGRAPGMLVKPARRRPRTKDRA
jgi:putative Holliday junction resolvase